MAVQDRRRDNIISITYEPQEEFTDHSNKEPMILTIVSNGTYQFELNGHDYEKQAPFIMCLTKQDKIKIHNKQGYCSAASFSFSPIFINSALTEEALEENQFDRIEDLHDRNLMLMFRNHQDGFDGLIMLDYFSAMKVNEWIGIMGSESLSQSDVMWTCRIRRYLLQVLYLLEDSYYELQNGKSKQKDFVNTVMEYIHTHYNQGIILKDLCEYANVNRTTLNAAFKKKTGVTVMRYLADYRIKMAKTTLEHTNLKLSEIAVCCGYNYETYFMQQFMKKEGLTPSEYREKKFKKRSKTE
ncbi:MAG: AraC family transcriptional regulator [Clostridiales bacterium]|nr:AraC family transcriptional regulator [Clostridiales bacterium]